jgi:membrane associated rhomboid family serine protease
MAVVEVGGLVALVGGLALSLVVLARLSDEKLAPPLRERFALGVPWGTLSVVVGVSLVYYLLQGGNSAGGPVVVGFTSWSLWYPQGLVLSAFSHSSDAHLVGNMLGTVAFGSVAEYAWGHYPTTSATRWDTAVRRIGLFVLATVLTGLASGLFVPGAVIGFSVVVFAFAGFALVMRPRLTVFAIVALPVVRLLRQAVLHPLVTARSRPVFVTPSWADIALQGHLFGVLVGVVLAVALVRVREGRPDLRYVWFAALVFAVTRSMYAVYWYESADQFVLFRALGTAGVFLLATLVALAACEPDWSLPRVRSVNTGTVAVGLLVVALAALAVSGLAYNLVSVSPEENVEDGIEIRDYRVAYVEDASGQYISAVELPGVGSPLSANVSGVVVASDRRNAWLLSVPASRLAFEGNTTVAVGDSTFRETVEINRTEWQFTGGNSTYRVVGGHSGDQTLLFTSEPATGGLRINGSAVRIEPTDDFYDVAVERNNMTVGSARIPPDGETVEIAEISFERTGSTLLARHEETEIAVATYRVRQRGSG